MSQLQPDISGGASSPRPLQQLCITTILRLGRSSSCCLSARRAKTVPCSCLAREGFDRKACNASTSLCPDSPATVAALRDLHPAQATQVPADLVARVPCVSFLPTAPRARAVFGRSTGVKLARLDPVTVCFSISVRRLCASASPSISWPKAAPVPQLPRSWPELVLLLCPSQMAGFALSLLVRSSDASPASV